VSANTTLGGEPVWLGSHPEQPDARTGGDLWIGQHGGDQDILILDPAETDSTAQVVALYSLTHHRTRSFPRSVLRDQIQEVTDELTRLRARKEYEQRGELRDAHKQALETARAERMDSIREDMIESHRNYIGRLGLEYEGVQKTGSQTRGGRSTKCHSCEIALDDFVGVTCAICSTVLCSCGACACGKPSRRKTAQKAAADAEAEG
jgi:hypothetical protein